jgi:hypothetical protein
MSIMPLRYGDWLPAGRPRGRISSPGRGKIFSLIYVVQTGSRNHTASYAMGIGGLSPGVKRSGPMSRIRGSTHSLPIRLHCVVLNLLSTRKFCLVYTTICPSVSVSEELEHAHLFEYTSTIHLFTHKPTSTHTCTYTHTA